MFALGLRNRVFWIVWWLKRWLNAGFWCLETGVWCGDMARVMWKRAVGGRGAAELGCNIRNMRLLMGGIGGGMRGLEFGLRVSELGSEGLECGFRGFLILNATVFVGDAAVSVLVFFIFLGWFAGIHLRLLGFGVGNWGSGVGNGGF